MNILVIGSGGREHAIVTALARSESANKIFATPGNPGIFQIAEKANIDVNNYKQIIGFCKSTAIDLVVIGPEQPLADGLSDELRANGINVFGPSKSAAQLESSKAFAKEFMSRHDIPTANFKQFHKSNVDEAHTFIEILETPIVLKADGLAAGKGVIIAETRAEGHDAIDEMFDGLFSSAGETVVIEEFLYGQEASIFAICDGENFVVLPSAQDHKRAYNDDKGPNTGGMGAYSPAPIVNEIVLDRVIEQIIKPTLAGMNAENNPFNGCLFVGLMIHNDEPNVIEFNVRFGDPETEAVLTLLDGDFAELLHSAAIGKINQDAIQIKKDLHACCVVLASNGYPGSFEKGFEIKGIEYATSEGAFVFQAGTKLTEGKIVSNGGRVIAVTGQGDSLKSAIDNAYKYADLIKFENKYNRTDIGIKGLN